MSTGRALQRRSGAAAAAQGPAEFRKPAGTGNTVTEFSPDPGPAVVPMRLQIFSDYLLPADSFDSLYGEFLSNT
jgi:hypothetical protein